MMGHYRALVGHFCPALVSALTVCYSSDHKMAQLNGIFHSFVDLRVKISAHFGSIYQ